MFVYNEENSVIKNIIEKLSVVFSEYDYISGKRN